MREDQSQPSGLKISLLSLFAEGGKVSFLSPFESDKRFPSSGPVAA